MPEDLPDDDATPLWQAYENAIDALQQDRKSLSEQTGALEKTTRQQQVLLLLVDHGLGRLQQEITTELWRCEATEERVGKTDEESQEDEWQRKVDTLVASLEKVFAMHHDKETKLMQLVAEVRVALEEEIQRGDRQQQEVEESQKLMSDLRAAVDKAEEDRRKEEVVVKSLRQELTTLRQAEDENRQRTERGFELLEESRRDAVGRESDQVAHILALQEKFRQLQRVHNETQTRALEYTAEEQRTHVAERTQLQEEHNREILALSDELRKAKLAAEAARLQLEKAGEGLETQWRLDMAPTRATIADLEKQLETIKIESEVSAQRMGREQKDLVDRLADRDRKLSVLEAENKSLADSVRLLTDQLADAERLARRVKVEHEAAIRRSEREVWAEKMSRESDVHLRSQLDRVREQLKEATERAEQLQLEALQREDNHRRTEASQRDQKDARLQQSQGDVAVKERRIQDLFRQLAVVTAESRSHEEACRVAKEELQEERGRDKSTSEKLLVTQERLAILQARNTGLEAQWRAAEMAKEHHHKEEINLTSVCKTLRAEMMASQAAVERMRCLMGPDDHDARGSPVATILEFIRTPPAVSSPLPLRDT